MSLDTKSLRVSIEPKTLFHIVLFGVALYLIVALRDIVLVLLTSIVLASFVEAVVKRFKRGRIPRIVTVLFVYLVVLSVLAVIVALFVPLVMDEISSLSQLVTTYLPRSTELGTIARGTLTDTKTLLGYLSGDITFSQFIKSFEAVLGGASGFFQSTANVLTTIVNIVLVAVITFYLSIQERGIENFLKIITPLKNEPYILDLWRRTERKIGLWVSGQLLLALLIGGLFFIGLSLLNIQYALVISLVAGLAELIPYGIVFAAIPSILIITADGGVEIGLKTLVLFVVVQQFENYVLAPLITKRVVGIPPLVVILALLIGASLAGMWGLILAVPCAVCLLEYIADVEGRKAQI